MTWTPELETGHAEIDAEHRELLRRVSAVIAAYEAGGDASEIAMLFDCLDAYVISHFASEERLMRDAGYPRLAAHRIEHDYFATAAARLRARLHAEGATPELLGMSKDFLLDWLTGHIAKSDREVVIFLQERPRRAC